MVIGKLLFTCISLQQYYITDPAWKLPFLRSAEQLRRGIVAGNNVRQFTEPLTNYYASLPR